jgi:hypothetical protein
VAQNDYAAAAATPDGTFAVVYIPSGRTVSIDMTKLSKRAVARWYDPTAGSYSGAFGQPLPDTDLRQFTTPGRNRAGDADWVLLLETEPNHGP